MKMKAIANLKKISTKLVRYEEDIKQAHLIITLDFLLTDLNLDVLKNMINEFIIVELEKQQQDLNL